MTLYFMGLLSVHKIVTMIFTEIPLERVTQCHTVSLPPGPSLIMEPESHHGLTFSEKHNSSPAWQKVKLGDGGC